MDQHPYGPLIRIVMIAYGADHQQWPLGNQWNRATHDENRKISGKDVPISCGHVNGGEPLMIMLKKILVIYHGKSDFDENTKWVLKLYSPVGASVTPYHQA